MRFNFLRILVTLVLLVARPTHAQKENGCPLNNVEFAPSKEQAPIAVEKISFARVFEQSISRLVVKNVGQLPINAVSLNVEFYRGSSYMLSMSFHAATASEQTKLQSTPQFSPLFTAPQSLFASLLPGEEKRMEESSPLLAIECPDTARVSVMQVKFSSGSGFDLRSSGWRSDAWLSRAKPWPLAGIPQRPTFIAVMLSVDETGKPHVISTNDVPLKVFDWLMERVESTWTFIPATFDGAPIASKLQLLFRFSPTAAEDPLMHFSADGKAPVAVVDVLSKAGGREYEMLYGANTISLNFQAKGRNAE